MRLADEVVRAMKTGNAVGAKDLWGDCGYQKQPPFSETVKVGNTLVVAWLSANLQSDNGGIKIPLSGGENSPLLEKEGTRQWKGKKI